MLGGVQFKDNNKAQPYTTIENYYKDFTKAFYEQLNTTIIKSSDKQLLLIVPAFYLSPFLTMMADDLRFNVPSSWNIEVSLELIKQEKAIADPARRPEYNTTKNFNLVELLRSFQTSTQKQVIVNPSDVQRLESIELIMENDNKLKVTLNLGGAKVDGRYAILINARDQNSGIYFIPIAPFIHKETILLPATKPFTPISDNVIDIGAQERTVSFYIPIHQIEWLYDRPNLNLSVQLQFIKSKDQGVLDTNNTNAYLSEQKILIYPAIRKN